MERRRLVGRRYEDYINNDIALELTDQEKLWRTVLADPRYSSLVERRRSPRRQNDQNISPAHSVFDPDCSFVFMSELLPEDGSENSLDQLP